MSKSPARNSRARLHEELLIKSSAIASAVNGMVFGDLEGRVQTPMPPRAPFSEAIRLEEARGLSALLFADSQEEAASIFADLIKHWKLDRRSGRAEERRISDYRPPVGQLLFATQMASPCAPCVPS